MRTSHSKALHNERQIKKDRKLFNAAEMYRTSNLGLVAYLYTIGHTAQKRSFQDGTCNFYFPKTPNLLQQVDAFTQRIARVEPVEFLTQYGKVKREMYSAEDELEG